MTVAHRLPLVLTLCLAAGLAQAAPEDDKRLALARDALHRAQAAAQSAQAERDQLQQQKAQLEQQKAASDQQLAKAGAQAASLSAQRAQREAALAAATTERDQFKTALETSQANEAELQKRLEALQGQLVQAQAQGAEQRRTTQSLAGILQRSVQSLAAAEAQNRGLADQGRLALSSWQMCEREGSGHVQQALGEAGFADTWADGRAEVLRREMEALMGPAAIANR